MITIGCIIKIWVFCSSFCVVLQNSTCVSQSVIDWVWRLHIISSHFYTCTTYFSMLFFSIHLPVLHSFPCGFSACGSIHLHCLSTHSESLRPSLQKISPSPAQPVTWLVTYNRRQNKEEIAQFTIHLREQGIIFIFSGIYYLQASAMVVITYGLQ